MATSVVGKLVYLITGDSTALRSSLTKSQRVMQSFGKDLVSLGTKLTRNFTLPLAAAGIAALKFAADIETQTVAFGVLLGDVELGAELFEKLKTFAAETPLQLGDITRGAQTLLAFGTAAEDVQEKLQIIGDVAQGNAGKLQRLTEAYGKLQAKGRASLEELNRFTENGVGILAALAEQLEVSTQEIFKMVSAGEISFEDVDAALTSMTSAGGQFEDMMLRISKTTAGKFSTAIDNVTQAAAGLVEILLPAVNSFLDLVTRGAKAIAAWDSETQRWVLAIAGVAAAIGPLLTILGLLTRAIAANPYVVLAAAIVTITLALIAWRRASNESLKTQRELKKAIEETAAATNRDTLALATNRREILAQAVERDKERVALAAERLARIASERARFKENITVFGAGQALQQLTIEEQRYTNELQGAQAALELHSKTLHQATLQVQALEGALIPAREETKGLTDDTEANTETQEERADRLQDLADKEAARVVRIREEYGRNAFLELDAREFAEDLKRKAIAETARLEEAVTQQRLGNVQRILAAVSSMFSAIGNLGAANTQAELQRIYEEHARRREDIEATITDETVKADALSALDDEFNAKRKALQIDAAATQKKFATFNVLLSTAAAIINAFTVKPVVLAPALAALAAATGLAQLAAISKTPTPSFATGGSFETNGAELLRVGENPGGRERVEITPLSSPNINGPGGTRVIVKLDSRTLLDVVQEATQNGDIIIDARSVRGL